MQLRKIEHSARQKLLKRLPSHHTTAPAHGFPRSSARRLTRQRCGGGRPHLPAVARGDI
jgi:hypothetical protein